MKVNDILTEDTPFRHSYPIQNSNDANAAQQLFSWCVQHYGHPASSPEVWVVSHEHMQDAARRTSHYTAIAGQVFGWYSSSYPGKVFISDRMHPGRSKRDAAILVHEFGHYLQDVTPKHEKLKPFTDDHRQTMEDDADELMNAYLQR